LFHLIVHFQNLAVKFPDKPETGNNRELTGYFAPPGMRQAFSSRETALSGNAPFAPFKQTVSVLLTLLETCGYLMAALVWRQAQRDRRIAARRRTGLPCFSFPAFPVYPPWVLL
jgi:hypothetical protein